MDIVDNLDRLIPRLLAERRVPGASVALIQGARVSWSRGYGVKRKDGRERVDTSTVFEAGSLTKPVFAHAFLQLVDAGRVGLDTPLSEVVLAPFTDDDARASRITVRHALSHTSGFPNWRGQDPLKTTFEPGSKFQYSGEGYVYLSRGAEALTGRPAHEWLRDAALTPLGMGVSSFVWEDRFDALCASGHGGEREITDKWKPDTPNAAASLHTTPSEYAGLVIAMMESPGDSDGLLSEALRRESLRPQVAAEEAISWGLGWGLMDVGDHETFWHWGENSSFTCFVAASRAERRGIVVMTNSAYGHGISQAVVEAVFGYDYPAFSSSLFTVW
ncbi:serine hydrolase [Candidatus Poribacteria bacterium]|nr:serine hydrolase [Candidatus Poribacteria bacterium]